MIARAKNGDTGAPAPALLNPDDRRPVMSLARRLAEAGLHDGAISMAALAISSFEASLERAADRAEAIACAAGCAFCCHQRVALTAPEGLFLLRWLQEREEGAVFLPAIAEAAPKLSRAEPADRIADPTPCPLLQDGLCGAYNHRPVACRGQASLSRSACEQALGYGAHVPISAVHVELRLQVAVAMTAALKAIGEDHQRYEMTSLLTALQACVDNRRSSNLVHYGAVAVPHPSAVEGPAAKLYRALGELGPRSGVDGEYHGKGYFLV